MHPSNVQTEVCTQGGLYLSRNEKKAAFSFYLSPTIYNGWVMQRKELIKEKRQLLINANEERSDELD